MKSRYRGWLTLIELTYGWYVTLISFFDGSGFYSLIGPKTLAGRTVVLGWEIACMLLLASYTANLAQVLVHSNAPVISLSASSFAELQASNAPVCVRFGTAISSLVTPMLQPRQAVLKPGGLLTSQFDAANALRSGACDGFVQPLWMAQDMLITGANRPCDLRLIFPTISKAAGGWVTASQLRQQSIQPNSTQQEGRCTEVLYEGLGFLLQKITRVSMSALRAAQQERLRNSTCLTTGKPRPESSYNPLQEVVQLDVVHFGGMFIVLLVTILGAVLSSNFAQSEGKRAKKHTSALLQMVHDVGGSTLRAGTISKTKRRMLPASLGAAAKSKLGKRQMQREILEEERVMKHLFSDLVSSRAPSTEEWQSTINQRLAKMDTRLGQLCDTIEVQRHQASEQTATAALRI